MAHYEVSGEGWKCMFSQEMLLFIELPLFFLQQKYDHWVAPNLLCTDGGNVDLIVLMARLLYKTSPTP